jgi:hypothetical protein
MISGQNRYSYLSYNSIYYIISYLHELTFLFTHYETIHIVVSETSEFPKIYSVFSNSLELTLFGSFGGNSSGPHFSH